MRPNEAISLSDWLTASFPPYLVIPNTMTLSRVNRAVVGNERLAISQDRTSDLEQSIFDVIQNQTWCFALSNLAKVILFKHRVVSA